MSPMIGLSVESEASVDLSRKFIASGLPGEPKSLLLFQSGFADSEQ